MEKSAVELLHGVARFACIGKDAVTQAGMQTFVQNMHDNATLENLFLHRSHFAFRDASPFTKDSGLLFRRLQTMPAASKIWDDLQLAALLVEDAKDDADKDRKFIKRLISKMEVYERNQEDDSGDGCSVKALLEEVIEGLNSKPNPDANDVMKVATQVGAKLQGGMDIARVIQDAMSLASDPDRLKEVMALAGKVPDLTSAVTPMLGMLAPLLGGGGNANPMGSLMGALLGGSGGGALGGALGGGSPLVSSLLGTTPAQGLTAQQKAEMEAFYASLSL